MPLDFKKLSEEHNKICATCGGKKSTHSWLWAYHEGRGLGWGWYHTQTGTGYRLKEQSTEVKEHDYICKEFKEKV